MMTNEELTFYCQLAAALLMGGEYFLPSHIRAKCDGKVTAYLEGVKQRFARDFTEALATAWSRKWFFLVGAACIFLGSVATYFSPALNEFVGRGWVYFSILLSVIFVYSFAFMAPVLRDVFLYCLFSVVFYLVPAFITKSPKGGLAAVGFVFLMMSFGAQYAALPG